MGDLDTSTEKIEQIGSTLSSIIPQLFFDLIARLIPGFAIIWSLYLALLGNPYIDSRILLEKISTMLPNNEFFLFFITVVVFYATSVVFYGLWSFIIHVRNDIKKFNKSEFVEVLEACPEFSFRHDFIKLKAPIAGNRITKLKAEIHMSGALTASFMSCLLISVVSSINSRLDTMDLIFRAVFFLIGIIGFFYSNQHFSERLKRSVLSYSELLGFKAQNYTFPTLKENQADLKNNLDSTD